MVFLVIIGLVMAILAILFAFQNATVIAINFGIWQFEQSLAIVLITTLGLGIIIGLLLSIYFLKQMQNQPNNQRYSSLIAMLFSVEPAKSQRNFADVGSQHAVYKAIANRFKNTITPDSFLGITERQRFISLTLGLRGIEVTEYAAYLQDKITKSPLQKADGILLPLKMSIGGVIVDPTDLVDSRSILKQAEQNLEESLEKGRGSLEISEVTSKTV